MRLDAEAPARVGKAVVDGNGRIGSTVRAIHGLEEAVFGECLKMEELHRTAGFFTGTRAFLLPCGRDVS